jgi:hypothetical protein
MKPDPSEPEFEIEEDSQHGVVGAYERVLRRFKVQIHAVTLIPIYLLAVILLGVSLVPAVSFYQWVTRWSTGHSPLVEMFALALGLSAGFFLTGFGLVLVVPMANLIIRPFVKPTRGQNYSTRFVGWYLHNALTYLVRYTFLDFITPTPFNSMTCYPITFHHTPVHSIYHTIPDRLVSRSARSEATPSKPRAFNSIGMKAFSSSPVDWIQLASSNSICRFSANSMLASIYCTMRDSSA